jgi:hypothetical protein
LAEYARVADAARREGLDGMPDLPVGLLSKESER